jgi:hypothetical protein
MKVMFATIEMSNVAKSTGDEGKELQFHMHIGATAGGDVKISIAQDRSCIYIPSLRVGLQYSVIRV